MDLIFLRDHVGCYGELFKKGTKHKYRPWEFEWQGMSEPERVERGIFIECHGHGEFDVFKPDDVTPNAKVTGCGTQSG